MSTAQENQRQGRKAYADGQYSIAHEYFTRALKAATSPDDQCSILDNRAATLEKLGDEHYLSALKDARRMMRVSRTSVRGYLRAGKILQLMENFHVAAATYEYGLGLIADEDVEGRRLLEGMYEKVQARAKAFREKEKARDPLSVLPVEIVDMVFRGLPFRTLMLLQCVSRGWRRFLSEYHRSYATLDFTGVKKPVPKVTVMAYLQRARGRTTKVMLEKFHPSMLAMIVTKSKKLSELSVMSTDFLPDGYIRLLQRDNLAVLNLHCQMSSESALDLIATAKNLEVLKCHRLGRLSAADLEIGGGLKLKKLVLTWDQPKMSGGRIVIKDFPELRELNLCCRRIDSGHEPADFRELRRLEKLVLRDLTVHWFPKVPDSLLHLDIRVETLNMDHPDVKALPSLESLGLPESSKINNAMLLMLLSATTSLRSLDLSMCPRINADSMDWLLDAGHGDSLEYLSLAGNPSFRDEVTRELGRLKKLKRLDIAHTMITGIGVANLVYREGSQLEWLGLDYCINVGRDAIEAANAVGVRVSHRMDHYFGARMRYSVVVG